MIVSTLQIHIQKVRINPAEAGSPEVRFLPDPPGDGGAPLGTCSDKETPGDIAGRSCKDNLNRSGVQFCSVLPRRTLRAATIPAMSAMPAQAAAGSGTAVTEASETR
jgi:hypothetical protein